jgi:dipeptidyl aminopeptidase/acylaminoacyl peptidase
MPTKDGWTVETLAHSGTAVGRAALSPEGKVFAFTVSSPTTGAELHLRDVDQEADRLLEQPNAYLSDLWLLSSPEDATFTGPGGETIEAWWYPPTVKVDEGKVPLVLYYYGGAGPTSRGFNFTHQFFAANGYAVLVVNPRGAYGYGDSFADHHAGDWGPAASADILAAADAFLVAHSDIDAERIGIYGGSYGGFMTMYLVTETDRFAAAVSLYGISDLATYWGQGAWGWTYGDMALAGATPWTKPDEFVKKSPLYRADRVQTPLLLLHGLDDTNVTPGESEEMFTALSMQDKMVELVLFPGENHGISGSLANRVLHRTMILEWFDKFLRDQPAAWEARWE